MLKTWNKNVRHKQKDTKETYIISLSICRIFSSRASVNCKKYLDIPGELIVGDISDKWQCKIYANEPMR